LTLLRLIPFNSIQALHSAATAHFSNSRNFHLQALFNIFHTSVCIHFRSGTDWVGVAAYYGSLKRNDK